MSISPFLLETSLKIIKVNCIFFCSPDQKGHVRYCHCVCSVIINVVGKLVWDVHLIILYFMFSLLNRKRKILHWVMRVCPFNWFYFYLYIYIWLRKFCRHIMLWHCHRQSQHPVSLTWVIFSCRKKCQLTERERFSWQEIYLVYLENLDSLSKLNGFCIIVHYNVCT